MTAGRAGVLTAVVVVAAGCGTTVVESDTNDAVVGAQAAPTSTFADPASATLDEVIGEIELLMFDLDQVIIDDPEAAADVLDRIDVLWAEADARIRAADPDELFNFEQAVELARSGVERRRPADASKGYKILRDVADAYLDR